jgi:glycosyltransferase involved in cell wall biosynthesis
LNAPCSRPEENVASTERSSELVRDGSSPYLSVDVIIPTRNRERFLEECIRSVERQTLKPRSVIVVDDGSSDGSLALLRKLASESDRLVVVPMPPRGVSAARNTAIARSTAELIAFLDSDDAWDKDKLEQQVRMFSADRPQLGLVYSGFRRVGDDGRSLNLPDVVPIRRGRLFDDMLHRFHAIALSTMVIRRDLLVRIGGFDENLVQAEDRDICLKLARISEFDCVSEPLVSFRVHDESTYERAIRHDPEFVLFQRLKVWNAWIDEIGEDVVRRFRREAMNTAPVRRFFRPRTGLFHRLRSSEIALARLLFPTPWTYFSVKNLRAVDLAKDFVARRLIAPNPPLLWLAHRLGRLKNISATRPSRDE